MQPENRFANVGLGQVDKEYLVEPAFSNQLRRQPRDVVRRRNHEYVAAAFLEPGEESSENARRPAAVVVATRKRFLDLVDPQHRRRRPLGAANCREEMLLA